MRMTHIVACTESGVIGIDGKMPWHLPADLKFFKQQTSGHCLLMGRKTFESIGRALPGRHSIVLTNSPSPLPENCQSASSFDAAIAAWRQLQNDFPGELFIIGGGEIYRQSLPMVDRVLLTTVKGNYTGDTYYPLSAMREQFRQVTKTCHSGPIDFSFSEWLRDPAS